MQLSNTRKFHNLKDFRFPLSYREYNKCVCIHSGGGSILPSTSVFQEKAAVMLCPKIVDVNKIFIP